MKKIDTNSKLFKIRHSLAHILAQAVLEIRPNAKLGFGPPIDSGFYYDFDLVDPLSPEELPKIEKRMRKIIKTGQSFVREELVINKWLNFLVGIIKNTKLNKLKILEIKIKYSVYIEMVLFGIYVKVRM